jgi:hypothetical protein
VTTVEMLTDLARSYDVKLTSHEYGPNVTVWCLRITNKECDFTYSGGDPARVVAQAWAGERP